MARSLSKAKYASSISTMMDQPALWVWIFLRMGSSINIFHAACGEFEALFFTTLERPAVALKTAVCGDCPTLVLVNGFQVIPDLETSSNAITLVRGSHLHRRCGVPLKEFHSKRDLFKTLTSVKLFEWYTASSIQMGPSYQSDSMRHARDVCEGICDKMMLQFSYYCKCGILVFW